MNNNTKYVGLTFTGLLQIVFIVLKLCNVIDWSWWIVFLPLIIDASLKIIIIIIASIFGGKL